jgi:hypothetical protein
MAVGAWILHAKGAPLRFVARRSAVLFLLTSAENAAVLCAGGLGLGTGLLPGRHGAVAGLGSAAFAGGGIVLLLALGHRRPRRAPAADRVALWAERTSQVVLDSLPRTRGWTPRDPARGGRRTLTERSHPRSGAARQSVHPRQLTDRLRPRSSDL